MKNQLPHAPGVYRVTAPSGAFYIGRAQDMHKRMLAHQSDARCGVHSNERLARTLRKYGKRMKWDVLLQTDSVESALHFEAQYLSMFWGDQNLMNQKKGDRITALENERTRRKPCYAMNIWTGGVTRLNYTGEAAAMFVKPRHWKPIGLVYGATIEECERKAKERQEREMKAIEREALEWALQRRRRLRYKYHVRNIHTGFVGCASLEELNAWGVQPHSNAQFKHGWQWRRFGAEWTWGVNCYKRAVFGLHVTGKKKGWRSFSECERDLGGNVNKALRGKLKTCKGWRLT